MTYGIKKDGRYVKDLTDGEVLTKTTWKAERYTTKAVAVKMAREYGRRYGKGFTVVELW